MAPSTFVASLQSSLGMNQLAQYPIGYSDLQQKVRMGSRTTVTRPEKAEGLYFVNGVLEHLGDFVC